MKKIIPLFLSLLLLLSSGYARERTETPTLSDITQTEAEETLPDNSSDESPADPEENSSQAADDTGTGNTENISSDEPEETKDVTTSENESPQSDRENFLAKIVQTMDRSTGVSMNVETISREQVFGFSESTALTDNQKEVIYDFFEQVYDFIQENTTSAPSNFDQKREAYIGSNGITPDYYFHIELSLRIQIEMYDNYITLNGSRLPGNNAEISQKLYTDNPKKIMEFVNECAKNRMPFFPEIPLLRKNE